MSDFTDRVEKLPPFDTKLRPLHYDPYGAAYTALASRLKLAAEALTACIDMVYDERAADARALLAKLKSEGLT